MITNLENFECQYLNLLIIFLCQTTIKMEGGKEKGGAPVSLNPPGYWPACRSNVEKFVKKYFI